MWILGGVIGNHADSRWEGVRGESSRLSLKTI